MILFIFEGNQREPDLYKTIAKLYFPEDNQRIICSFGNNLYELYRVLQEDGDDCDIVALMKERFEGREDNPFSDIEQSSDFSEIYLFFDYDFQNNNLQLDEINKQVGEMLELFDDETDKGKLYINYPMIESIRYTKELPDSEYYSYTVTRDDCHNFKGLSAEFSAYNSLDSFQIDKRKNPTEEKLAELRQNWQYLKDQNVCKAHFICNDQNWYPASKNAICQSKIFETQIDKYVSTDPCRVAILNAFPLFLYDYFK